MVTVTEPRQLMTTDPTPSDRDYGPDAANRDYGPDPANRDW